VDHPDHRRPGVERLDDDVKTPEQVLGEIATRLGRTWSDVVAGATWTPDFQLGTSALKGRRLVESWSETHRLALRWEDWVMAAGGGVDLEVRTVSVHRSPQTLPGTLRIATIDTAARIVGAEWPSRIGRARARADLLLARFPALDDLGGVLRATDSYSEVDFELLCRTAAWFAAPHPEGLTARQVPVEGLGTKWLSSRTSLVRRLAGVESLDLQPGRPSRVHVTYLDPSHLAAGGRRHDVATIGDVDTVAYRPRVVVISENRDTAQQFPLLAGGIAVEGEGRGAGAVAALPWIHDVETIWYWGDMDADGLEILNGFRVAGIPARSLFMDFASYERWERYGVDTDHHGAALGPRSPRDVALLEPSELELYLALCSTGWSRHRRIEQERIPIEAASAAICRR
jgi:hypothetical protein